MTKQEIFIEYMKSQKETIYSLVKLTSKEKRKILVKLNQKMEDQKLNINIQEINNKIVFAPIGRERFKKRVLYDFLCQIFSGKYTNEFWGIMEEFENKSYVSIENFFYLAEKIKNNEKDIGEITEDTEDIKNLILLLYQNIRNRKFSEALKGYKKLLEKRKGLFVGKLKKNLDNLLKSTYSAMETSEYEEFSASNENDMFIDCLNKCEAFMKEEITKLPEEENISKITKKIIVSEIEIITEKENKRENKIFESGISKTNISYIKKNIEKEELRPKSIKELMGEIIQQFENYDFDKAVENIKILAETGRSFIKNNTELKYLLEAVLLRTVRFFIQRKEEYKKYWGFFLGKYEMKIEFYQNIIELRGYLGKNSKFWYEEYEVWRKD